jgi:drug/metabolite transporter (DMT)-like permease
MSTPIVAVLLGALFAHEKITTLHIISLSLIIAGVFLVNSSAFKRKRDLQLSTC